MKVWFEISNPKYVHFLRFFGHVEIIRFKMLMKTANKKGINGVGAKESKIVMSA